MTSERTWARLYTRYPVVLQWHIVALPWAEQSQGSTVLAFPLSKRERQHFNWCSGAESKENAEASRPQLRVYSRRPSPASPLTFPLLNSPPLCLPEVLAGYYPRVCGKLCAAKRGGVRRKRSLWSGGEKEGAALLSTNLLCVSGLSLINDRLCESRPAALASGSTPWIRIRKRQGTTLS